MPRGIFGKFLALLAIVVMLLEIFYFIQLLNYNAAMTDIRVEANRVIDNVRDNKLLTKTDLESWNLALASKGVVLRGTIRRNVLVVNPTESSSEPHVSKIPVDDIYNWNQGDELIVEVEVVSDGAGGFISRFMKNGGDFGYARTVR